jgi:hypothetical protein
MSIVRRDPYLGGIFDEHAVDLGELPPDPDAARFDARRRQAVASPHRMPVVVHGDHLDEQQLSDSVANQILMA